MKDFTIVAKPEQTKKFGAIYSQNKEMIQLKCAIIPLNTSNPDGYRMMNRAEVVELKDQIKQNLDQWGIVAFDHGKIDGPGYGCKIHDSYGNECGNKLIVKFMKGFNLVANIDQVQKFGPLPQPTGSSVTLKCGMMSLKKPTPNGYRIMNRAEVVVLKNQISQHI